MNWDNVLDRLEAAQFKPVEEIYMEHYGKVLTAEFPEFKGRYFRCTYGALKCGDIRIEVFLFPSEFHRDEFLEVIGNDPRYVSKDNAVLRFPECQPGVIDNILRALVSAPR